MLLLVIIPIVLLVTYELFYKRKLKACAKRLPGFPMVPFLGNAHQVKTTPTAFLKFVMKTSEYGKISRFMIGPMLFVVVTDPVDIEFITTNLKLTEKSAEYDLLKPWLGDGILISSGSKWKIRRKLLTPSFHFNILKDYIPVFDKNAEVLVKKLGIHDGEPVDISPMVTLCTLDAMAETAMGVKLDAQLGNHGGYVNAVKKISLIINKRFTQLLWRFDVTFKLMPVYKEYKTHLQTLHAMIRGVIKERKQALGKAHGLNGNSIVDADSVGIKKRQSFLDTLLHFETANGKLSDEDVRAEVETFMFEGHDTTSAAMSFLLYNMAQNPEIQEKVYQEQLSIYGDDASKQLSHEDVNNMKYTEMVIKESMRIYPPVPFIIRNAPFDFDLNDTEIPAGCSIMLNIISMNRNPEVFPDPMKFIPERFSIEESSKRHPFSNITFSAGPRNCIGQRFALTQLKCIFSKVIKHLEFFPGDKDLELGSDLILKSYNGIDLRVRRRSA